jgi:uncharacterized membrane protein
VSLWFLIFGLLGCGVFFRFYNIDKKCYWHDEAWTSIRLSGYRSSEVTDQVFNGREVGVGELQKYQHINPDRGLYYVLFSLAASDPNHPPFYYLLLWFWIHLFGESIATIRCLSAIIGLLAFPCIYWLCLELFGDRLIAWTATILFALSPFHILYAQEARSYSLLTVAILLSSAVMLRAVRLETDSAWRLYTVTICLGIFSHLLFLLVLFSHGAYIVGIRFRKISSFSLARDVSSYLKASLLGFVAFLPWVIIIIVRFSTFRLNSEWTSKPMGFFMLVKQWLFGLSSIFIDTYSFASINLWPVSGSLFKYSTQLSILILTGYSIYFLCRRTSKEIWLFVITLIGITMLTMILPDLFLGGRRSASPRYMIPCYLGVELSVAFLLANKIVSAGSWQRGFCRTLMVVLIVGGIISSVVSSQADYWWNKGGTHNNPQIARIINSSSRPLLASDAGGANLGNILSLSHLLDQKVRFRLLPDPATQKYSLESDPFELSDGFSDLFLFNPSPATQKIIAEKNYKVKKVSIEDNLWRIEH